MNKLFLSKRNQIIEICQKHDVKRLYVFGSILSDQFKENSDIDLLISFKKIPLEKYADNYFDLKFSLEDLFKRQIDLLEEKTISNPFLKKSIDSSKKLIYG